MKPRRFSHDTNGRNANVPPGLGGGLVSMVFWGDSAAGNLHRGHLLLHAIWPELFDLSGQIRVWHKGIVKRLQHGVVQPLPHHGPARAGFAGIFLLGLADVEPAVCAGTSAFFVLRFGVHPLPAFGAVQQPGQQRVIVGGAGETVIPFFIGGDPPLNPNKPFSFDRSLMLSDSQNPFFDFALKSPFLFSE